MITGASSGIGRALATLFLEKGFSVYALSRRNPGFDNPRVTFISCNLNDFDAVPDALARAIPPRTPFEYVILNAGVLGKIEPIAASDLNELKAVMDVNVWANKLLIDTLLQRGCGIKQMIAISSGAAVNGSKGWGGYSLSKAALNMLMKLYAGELESTHITALAPGLVLTPMLEGILMGSDPERFPSVARIQAGEKRTAEEAATLLFELFPKLLEFESGSFVDVRNL